MLLQFLKTAAVLAGVLGLIFLLAHFFKRFGLTGTGIGGQKEGWRVLGVKSIGPRRHVYALEVGSKIAVIGVTDKSMTSLMEIADPAECERVREALADKKTPSVSFTDFLRKANA